MSNFKYIFFLILCLGAFTACEFDPLEDEDGIKDIQTSNPFVRFTPGQDGESEEEGEVLSINVEFGFPIESDLTVDYTLGGDAVFGEDYTIEGASASGGSIAITFDPNNVNFNTNTIDIQIPTDCVIDGGKNVTVTLEKVTAANGVAIDAGQGSIHKTITVSLEDGDLAVTIADIADFSSLTAAIDAAGLTSALRGAGPFTAFGPGNDAFQALLDSNPAWNSLEDIQADTLTQLSQIVGYHVIQGENTSDNIQTGYYTTVAMADTSVHPNAPLTMYISVDNGVEINGTTQVTPTDCLTNNGVAHTLNEVLLPADILTFALTDPNFSSLVAALTTTGLTTDFVNVLSGAGPFTVFAPTNDAFQALLDSNPDWNSLADIPVATLEAVLLYHVIGEANVRSTDLVEMDGMPILVTTLGGNFSIDLIDGESPQIIATNSTATIIATDVQGTNGVIHVVDTVLLP